MTTPKVGDRVRVTFDMDVAVSSYRGTLPAGSVKLGSFGEGDFYVIPGVETREIVSVEVLPPPEPDFFPLQPGDVVQVSATTYFVSADFRERGTIEDFSDWLRDWRNGHPRLTCELVARNGKAAV